MGKSITASSRTAAFRPSPTPEGSIQAAEAWMAARGWQPFEFQRQTWAAMAAGASGLVHASTGAGKTLAVWLGALAHLCPRSPPAHADGAGPVPREAAPLSVLWVTPMRALAADTVRALQEPLAALAPHWRVGLRSGDTPPRERTAQAKRLPTVLVTTPESLCLLLARADAQAQLGRTALVVADEWHELLGSKRGILVQLALARLRSWNPALQTWGLSATLGNLPQALAALLGPEAAAQGVLIEGQQPKTLLIDTLLPPRPERFAWAGHLGLAMLPAVVAELEAQPGTLLFTNTRALAEQWYQALLEARPDWAGAIALHHGSLAREVREWVEAGLKTGTLRAVVCTSSLDLGVDFLPVQRVLHIGSPKGIARLLQRAGRSGHAPGRPSRITLVPTHALELLEASAARAAVQAGQVEARQPPQQPLDVLVQHLVTVALGGGFEPEALLAEVRRTAAYAQLSEADWRWCLDFVRGGGSLHAYPDFHRLAPDADGRWHVTSPRLARRHRANIGTIVSEASMQVQFVGGAKLGQVEEGFIARLKPGDAFLFAGRMLELVRVRDMTAWVRRASTSRGAVARWSGGSMPLSTCLAEALLEEFEAIAPALDPSVPEPPNPEAPRRKRSTPQVPPAEPPAHWNAERRALWPLLRLQAAWSALPRRHRLLAETLSSRDGHHLFLYPFAGHQVHLGLAHILAWRLARHVPLTLSMAVNDYGLELLSATPVDWAQWLPRLLAASEPLAEQALASLNASELAQRRFREIARVAGLVFQSHPSEQRSSRQLQASASLYYQVFAQHDPGNLLLRQARDELLAQELDIQRLEQTLTRMASQTLLLRPLARPTPLALGLMVQRLRERLSTESLAQRIARMLAPLEAAAQRQGL